MKTVFSIQFQRLFRRHAKAVLITSGVTFLLFVAVGFFTSRVYEAHTAIYIHKRIPTAATNMDLPDFTGPNLVDHVRILESKLVLDYVAPRLRQAFPHHANLSASALTRRLKVVSAKNTKVIDLSFQDDNPRYAAKLLELVLAGYDDSLKHIATEAKDKSAVFLKNRLTEVQLEKEALNTQISLLQTEAGSTDIDKKNDEMLQVSSSFQTTLGNVDAQRASIQREMSQIEKTLNLAGKDMKGLLRFREDPVITQLQQEEGRLQGELSGLKGKFTDKHYQVIEKRREIAQTQNQIEDRIKELGVGALAGKTAVFSEAEKNLGQRYLELQVQLLGLNGQKQHYQSLVGAVQGNFETLVKNKQQIENLVFQRKVLEEEEEKLISRMQDNLIDQATLDELGMFTMITPPSPPDSDDYIFPPHPVKVVMGGLLASLLFGLFTMGLLEYLEPRQGGKGQTGPPMIARVKTVNNTVRIEDVKSVYQSLYPLIREHGVETLALFHLCDARAELHPCQQKSPGRLPVSKCAYAPSFFARQLGNLFAAKENKILLVDCSIPFASDASTHTVIETLPQHTLYRYAGLENLDILSPNTHGTMDVSRDLLQQVPNLSAYSLVLLNASLSDQDLLTTQLWQVADAAVLWAPPTSTGGHWMGVALEQLKQKQVNVLGTIAIGEGGR